MVLPTLALAAGQIAVYMRLLRTDMIATLQEDYIGVARAKGMPTRRILLPPRAPTVQLLAAHRGRHQHRPRSSAARSSSSRSSRINGLGTLLVRAIFPRDYLVVQGAVVIIAVGFVLVNFLVDILYAVLDPRIRHARALSLTSPPAPARRSIAGVAGRGHPVGAIVAEDKAEHEVKKLGFRLLAGPAGCSCSSRSASWRRSCPSCSTMRDERRCPELIGQGEEVPPSADHWFGADNIGHDVFSRVVWGGRVSLLIGVAAVAFGFLVGGDPRPDRRLLRRPLREGRHGVRWTSCWPSRRWSSPSRW